MSKHGAAAATAAPQVHCSFAVALLGPAGGFGLGLSNVALSGALAFGAVGSNARRREDRTAR